MAKADFDPAYGITKAAAYLGVHRTTFDRWRKAGKAPEPSGCTPTGDLRWRKSALDQFLRESLENRVE